MWYYIPYSNNTELILLTPFALRKLLGKRLPTLNRTSSTRKKSPPGRLLPRFLSLPTTFCRPTPTTTTFLPPHPRPPLPSAAGAAKRRAAVRPSHLQHLAQPAPPLNHQHPRVPPSTPTCAPPPLCSSPPKATWLPPTVAALPNPVRSGRSGDPATSNRRCPAGSGEIWPPRHGSPPTPTTSYYACSSSPARRAALLCLDGTAPPPSGCSVLFPHHGHKCRFSRLQLGWVVAEVWRHLRSLEPLATIESSVLQ
ncbi:extensin [Triticum aestivum]|uniref:extensin n=1 Tax=Triticum aestivum TaxID=4565 RepID=UPI001D016438|nr:extensin-like [Triticum aestivum]